MPQQNYHDRYDIDTLPPYDTLDIILKGFIEDKNHEKYVVWVSKKV